MSIDLSIIVISYNTRDITLSCLSSIYESDPICTAEVIVVDNASEDSSADLIESQFPSVMLIRNESNLGFAAANNQAFEIATGRYLLLLNSDTVVLGDVLDRSVQFMDARIEVGVLGCRVLNPDKTMQSTCFMFPSLLNVILMTTGLSKLPWPRFLGRADMKHWKRDSERDVDVVTGCYMMVRREAMEEVGRLDDSFFFCGEETDWCYRFKKADWRVVFSPVGEIIHIGNASGRRFEAKRDLMLTQGIIRFLKKQRGQATAATAYLLLAIFNLSRAGYWQITAVITRSDKSLQRANHFIKVCKGYKSAWPS
ncbi:MAG: glycosyltransferase family 2 protein [Pseudomonadales bacterium]